MTQPSEKRRNDANAITINACFEIFGVYEITKFLEIFSWIDSAADTNSQPGAIPIISDKWIYFDSVIYLYVHFGVAHVFGQILPSVILIENHAEATSRSRWHVVQIHMFEFIVRCLIRHRTIPAWTIWGCLDTWHCITLRSTFGQKTEKQIKTHYCESPRMLTKTSTSAHVQELIKTLTTKMYYNI